MKGIYLTKQGKQEIEAEIAKFEKEIEEEVNPFIHTAISEALNIYKEILSSATILPVEESFYDLDISNVSPEQKLYKKYPNGVIIKSKE